MSPRAPIVSLAAATATLLLGAFLPPLLIAQAPAAPTAAPPTAGPQKEAQAQSQGQVTLELQRNQRPLMRMAIPAFHRGPLFGEAAQAGSELEEVVRQDLQASGYFEIQGPAELAGLPLTGDVQRDVEVYRGRGNEVLVLGDLKSEEGRLVFEGRVFDLGHGNNPQPILAKRYRGDAQAARRIAHTFADEVIKYLIGQDGIALSTLAFTSDRTGFKEIFLMDYDGRNQRRITGHRSTSMSPAWSPDGRGLAYTSFFQGPPAIYFADLDNGRKLPIVTSGSLNITPSFSPDGARVVFARSLAGNVEIFICDRDGGNLKRLTNSAAIDTNPAWSPTGGQIAFTSSRAGNPHIYLMDPEGTNQRRISFDGTYNDGAAWSPDGSLLAYTTRRSGVFQIAVTNVVTLDTKVLTGGNGENESPTFSPDGRKIAFTSRRTGTKQIFVMDLNGNNLRQLTDAGNNDMADWSRKSAPAP